MDLEPGLGAELDFAKLCLGQLPNNCLLPSCLNQTADWLRDFMSPTTVAGAAADSFWRQAPLLGLQLNSRCHQFRCQQHF